MDASTSALNERELRPQEFKEMMADTPLFLALPRELRDKVYQYLLSAEYTEGDDTRYTEKASKRHYLTEWREPCSFYTIEHAILSVNRQINLEATHILRANQFVCITADFQMTVLGFPLLLNIPTLAIKPASRILNHCTANVHLGLYYTSHPTYLTYATMREINARIIAGKDFTRFCRNVRAHNDYFQRDFFETIALTIDTHSKTAGRLWKADKDFPQSATWLRNLLEPLRCFHSIPSVTIDGQVSNACWSPAMFHSTVKDPYNEEIMASVRKSRPSTNDLMEQAYIHKTQGDDAYKDGQYTLATSRFSNALDDLFLQSDLYRFPNYKQYLLDTPDNEHNIELMMFVVAYDYQLSHNDVREFVWSLWMDKAIVHVALEEYEDAYIWLTAAIYESPFRWALDTPHKFRSDLFLVRATALKGMGKLQRAAEQIRVAMHYYPDYEPHKVLLEKIEAEFAEEHGEVMPITESVGGSFW